jgi:hypothetical protein
MMTHWHLIATAPKHQAFVGWDGEARFLCAWREDRGGAGWDRGDAGWVVVNTDAAEDWAADSEARPRSADPTHWRSLDEPPG